ncbi:hypothetical protein V5P93_002235 [Actinokineospora auranticolor]|uniref:Antibiotic biosynthesis monooxygenase n=1 Tax=Actinokineospora auranticolor TaxID=155976 RepID=A0A2S6GEM1_9PSEU|nr:hypothetical protein [Actinokineospora auranticolor]PPK63675.1 hypothetical protein CLV40_12510 [Actinokineospora auranticolor]
MTMRQTTVSGHAVTAGVRIDSWWRLPTPEEADAAAEAALAAMPAVAGLLRFSVLRSPTEPTLFLQSLWVDAPHRDAYVQNVAAAPRAAVDEKVPTIIRDCALTEITHVIVHAETPAASWRTRRIPTTDPHALAAEEESRLRRTPPAPLLRASIGITPTEVVVIEEWTGVAPAPAYLPLGAVTPANNLP